ncbi:hypothetical protein C8J57DRAFT_1568147 [Mycena rebaudengoi]|nr:hypothetical protein C8J57DRAFT_1259494 [Mycena rebaudengoi]KAJ7237685.1 hypothetical protein C8J57DRAFT_1568147 [Mycena rebaudengoi]
MTDAQIPKLARTLFAQDIWNEDSPVRPIFERETYEEITPPGSPLARFNPGTPLETLFFGTGNKTPESSPTTLVGSEPGTVSTYGTIPSPRGLILGLLGRQAHDIYLQFIQFALGGISDPQARGTISPKGVFRTWSDKHTNGTAEEPFWVKYHRNNGYALRDVSLDFAVGRVALLALCPENIAISNDLLNWAEKLNPLARELPDAQRDILFNRAPEDTIERVDRN